MHQQNITYSTKEHCNKQSSKCSEISFLINKKYKVNWQQ